MADLLKLMNGDVLMPARGGSITKIGEGALRGGFTFEKTERVSESTELAPVDPTKPHRLRVWRYEVPSSAVAYAATLVLETTVVPEQAEPESAA